MIKQIRFLAKCSRDSTSRGTCDDSGSRPTLGWRDGTEAMLLTSPVTIHNRL